MRTNWTDRRRPCWSVLALLGVLALAGCTSDTTVDDESVLAPLLKPLMPPKPSQAVRWLASNDPDKRRDGLALLSGAPFGGEEVYLRLYRVFLQDRDDTVRAAAVQAVGLWGQVADVSLLMRSARDPAPIVRWEAAQALQKIHNPIAVRTLTDLLTSDSDSDVRTAAAIALAQYPRPEVFNTLVGALDDPEWGVDQAAYDALICLTGEDFGPDGPGWLKFQQTHAGRLFDHEKQYVWYPFVKPRGFWDKVQFWSRPKVLPPRVPTGMQTAATAPTGAPKS